MTQFLTLSFAKNKCKKVITLLLFVRMTCKNSRNQFAVLVEDCHQWCYSYKRARGCEEIPQVVLVKQHRSREVLINITLVRTIFIVANCRSELRLGATNEMAVPSTTSTTGFCIQR